MAYGIWRVAAKEAIGISENERNRRENQRNSSENIGESVTA